MQTRHHILVFGLFFLASTPLPAAPTREEVIFQKALTLEPVGRAGRNTVFTDEIEFQIVNGTWHAPHAGDQVGLPAGRLQTWTNATANAEGWFEGPALRGGYAFVAYESATPQIMVLEAAGHSSVYVNGELRAGDVYQTGYVRLPVALRAGVNEFLFAGGRGRLRAKLVPPPSPVFLNLGDPTFPDLIVGEKTDAWGAVVVVNATTNWLSKHDFVAKLAGRVTRCEVPSVPPLGVRKVPFHFVAPAPKTNGMAVVELALVPAGKSVPHAVTSSRIELRVRRPEQTHKRTFISETDGSVQYFAVNPASGSFTSGERPALFLSLHGASVEALGQAEAYAPKRWGTLVAPTNRRPYGFDWEEWGRLDALEVLALATARYQPDPLRMYLTGHSMGGHGTWNIGANFPDRFAAIAPSAGWISFWSYAGTDRFTNATPVQQMLRRANAPGDTLGLSTNYLSLGVYTLHGDADDNVPVSEARTMRTNLAGFHHDFDGHEQPGAGHWWGNSDEPGAACVDWPPLFDFFARHRRPAAESVRRVNFTTMNPGVSARSQWLEIAQQERSLIASRAAIQLDPLRQRFTGTTENVARLAFDVPTLIEKQPVVFELDGQKLTNAPTPRVWLVRHDGRWETSAAPSAGEKTPQRSGPFKDAFRHRVVFVFGTQGTAEENAWAMAKARYDAEAFWYRGNGSIEVLADSQFDPRSDRDRGVILYGHREMNAAWLALLADSPVQVDRSGVTLGTRTILGGDVACLFLRPRPGSAVACVGVVAGSGLAGLRVTNRLPYFLAGTGYPDCLVVGAETLRQGTDGIRVAGFFGNDWSVTRGDFAWRE